MSGWKKLGLLPACLAGIAAAMLLTSLLCLAMTPLVLRGMVPPEACPACAAAAAGIGAFAAVFLTARLRGRQALPAAGVIAGGMVLLAALVCALGGKKYDFGPWLLRLAAAAASGGIIGAVMSIRGHGGRRRRRRG